MDKKKNIKVIDKQYAIRVNGEITVTKRTRKEIYAYAKNMKLDDSVNTIELVRHNITEYSIKKFTATTQKVLVSSDLSLDIDSDKE